MIFMDATVFRAALNSLVGVVFALTLTACPSAKNDPHAELQAVLEAWEFDLELQYWQTPQEVKVETGYAEAKLRGDTAVVYPVFVEKAYQTTELEVTLVRYNGSWKVISGEPKS